MPVDKLIELLKVIKEWMDPIEENDNEEEKKQNENDME